jgi:hypothetical protein
MFPTSGNGRKEIRSKTWRNVNVLLSVPLRSDAYRNLCDTSCTTVHCQPKVSVLLTAGNVRHTTERCFHVRWLRLHSVLPASPVKLLSLKFEPPSPSTAVFHYIKVTMFADFDFFVVANLNKISSIFREWFRRIKKDRLTPSCYLTNHCPLNTALSAVRAVHSFIYVVNLMLKIFFEICKLKVLIFIL